MASLRWSASTLLASLILLYWTTSSAWSHSSTDRSALHRIARDLDFETRQKTEKVLETATNSLSLLNDVMGKIDTNSLKSMMKNLANFASLAPGVGAVISSVINMALVFIPQEDPVLTKLEQGFAEVNSKLDSLSTQISDLATDVEWFNYVSVYSQNEVRILNTWRKFVELKRHGFKNFKPSAQIFKDYYKDTQTEASVDALYLYLTGKTMILGKNLNDLLKSKFKCDLNEINKYNFYLSSLLWKGLVLKEVYGKLIDSTSDKEAEHAQMLKSLYEVQRAAMEYCIDNSEEQMKKDVKDIGTAHISEEKTAVAEKVKNALDKKYSWYNWVVLVYDKKQEDDKYIYVYDMTKIPISDQIIVAVTYTLKADSDSENVKKIVQECFSKKPQCDPRCSFFPWETYGGLSDDIRVTDYAKLTHAAYNYEFAELPPPVDRTGCSVGDYRYKISVHVSTKTPVCQHNPCQNNGQCKQLLKSNEWLCVCQDGYFGDTCETKVNTTMTLTV
ncbi:SE-cephalotoxin-like [Colossoma macropomum]|uniref:SE-cephalotoxin-like n=1 Tax=Colossoma macropomum TaxID=42526 RepID=UPI001863AB54|nr:SE-cephalotoxin-like [Colossoma macropomum]